MRETWASRFGFVMATAGFAVGLGNIWRFPTMTGNNGGGAFLVVYLLFAFWIGIPLLTAEISLGRQAQRTPIAGMQRLTGSWRHPWNLIGWLGVVASLIVQSYYVMLIGWILGYFVRIVRGGLSDATVDSLGADFAAFTASPVPVLGYTAIVVLILVAIVGRGLRGGLERVASVAMPLLVVLLVALAVRSLTFPGAWRGLVWYLQPDFGSIDGATILAALGQAFFSIGIGMATAFGFGSYLARDTSDVPGNAAIVVVFDTAIAVLAGLVIFPALFAFGIEPDAGPGLLFVTMTGLFAEMPAGQLFGATFFFLLLLAAITSSAALHEVLVVTWIDLVPVGRRTATWGLAGLFLLLSVPMILSQGPWADVQVAGMDLFTFADTVSGSYLLPIGALILVLYTATHWGFERFRDDTNRGAGRIRVTTWWKPLMLCVIPVAMILVLLGGIGLV
ncbi:MAG: sodium-dependent transporter [Acidobacteriota bacterium]